MYMVSRASVILYCALIVALNVIGRGAAGAPAKLSDSTGSSDDAWVSQEADALVSAARRAYLDDKAQKRYEKVLDAVVEGIKQRKLAEGEQFTNRYREFVDYVETASITRQDDHELGFNVPDRQYFDETREYVKIPDFLIDQTFLRDVSRWETLGRAKAYLRRLNLARGPDDQLLFLSYTSQHLGAADNRNSFRRLLVVVPADREKGTPDKWVQFSVTDPRARPLVRNTSVVTAILGPDGTYNAYFKDFYRTFQRGGLITLKGRWELGDGDDNCAQCHKSGVLPIFPEPGSVPQDELPVVSAVNERFRSYGSPRFGGYLDESKLGPGLSSESSASREARFGPAFTRTAVGKSMSCAGCHRPEGLGPLNWPMDRTVISSFIEGGQMPLGAKLTDTERAELYKKLVEEYFSIDPANPGILKSWLLGRARQSSQP